MPTPTDPKTPPTALETITNQLEATFFAVSQEIWKRYSNRIAMDLAQALAAEAGKVSVTFGRDFTVDKSEGNVIVTIRVGQ